MPKGGAILLPLIATVTFRAQVRPEDREGKDAFLARVGAARAGLAEPPP